jgi:hypothetical protein
MVIWFDHMDAAMTHADLTVSASVFKARCPELLRKLDSGALMRVTVTILNYAQAGHVQALAC